MEDGLRKSPAMYSFKERELFNAIRRDVNKTFTELGIFQVSFVGGLSLEVLFGNCCWVVVDNSVSGEGPASSEPAGGTDGVFYVSKRCWICFRHTRGLSFFPVSTRRVADFAIGCRWLAASEPLPRTELHYAC